MIGLGMGFGLGKASGSASDGLSLDLQFAADKTLTARKGPTPTFIRGSGATQVNAAGLIEWAPENLMLNSGNVSLMSRLNVPVAISQTGGPLGSYYTLGVNAINDFHIYRNSGVTPAASASSMMWVLAKRGTARYLRMGGGSASTFDWDALTFSSVSTTHSAGDPVAVGDGWYWLPILRGLTEFIDLAPSSSSGVAFNYNETANVTVEVAAIQVSRSALLQNVAPTYIPTTTAAIYGARFDHDPLTLACKGLLIEEQRTNLFVQSADFSTTWSQIQVALSTNVTTSPYGDVTADKVVPNSASTISRISQTFTLTGSHSMSVFAKSSEWGWLFIGPISGGVGVWFNLSNGTVGTQSSGFVGSIVSFGNGWYRCAVSFTGATTSQPARIVPTDADNTITSGDGTSGLFLWGAQLEAGSFPTSYIPTTTAAVTRSADVCSITGSDFSGFYNPLEGSLFTNTIFNAPTLTGSSQRIWELSSANTLNSSRSFRSVVSGACGFRSTSASVTDVNFDTAVIPPAQQTKQSFGFIDNNFAYYSNNAEIGIDTLCSIPASLNALYIGSNSPIAGGGGQLNGTFASLRYFKKRLPNAKLQALTV